LDNEGAYKHESSYYTKKRKMTKKGLGIDALLLGFLELLSRDRCEYHSPLKSSRTFFPNKKRKGTQSISPELKPPG